MISPIKCSVIKTQLYLVSLCLGISYKTSETSEQVVPSITGAPALNKLPNDLDRSRAARGVLTLT